MNRPVSSSGQQHFSSALADVDSELSELIAQQNAAANETLPLIASENYASRAQLEVQGSGLNNVVVEGYPGARLHGAAPIADKIEQLAIDRACELFGVRFANVQVHSGTQANQAVFLALLDPGDCILSMSLVDGGHFSHAASADNMLGRWMKSVHYGLVRETELIDYDEMAEKALSDRPKIIVVGGSAYPRAIDFERVAEIAATVGARVMFDAAHVAGVVAGGQFPNPFPYVDIMTTTTYKNLRSVQGGIILCNDPDLAAKIDDAVCPGVQGVPLFHTVAARAVAFKEALSDEYKVYCKQVLKNARALGAALQGQGIRLLTNGTDVPFVVGDVRSLNVSGPEAVGALESVGISSNAVFLPGDPPDFKKASALRLGVSAISTRGMTESDCDTIAAIIISALKARAAGRLDEVAEDLRSKVMQLCKQYPAILGQ